MSVNTGSCQWLQYAEASFWKVSWCFWRGASIRERPKDLQFTDKLPGSGNTQHTCSLLLLQLRICLEKYIVQLSNRMMQAMNRLHDSLSQKRMHYTDIFRDSILKSSCKPVKTAHIRYQKEKNYMGKVPLKCTPKKLNLRSLKNHHHHCNQRFSGEGKIRLRRNFNRFQEHNTITNISSTGICLSSLASIGVNYY